MPTLKEYNGKLARLRNSRKMTKTMKMVSAVKLRRVQAMEKTCREFTERLDGVLPAVMQAADCSEQPLMLPHRGVKRILLLVVTSDRGLCAGFNNNLNRTTIRWMKENRETYPEIDLAFHGRRGHLFFRKQFPVKHVYEGVSGQPSFEAVRRMSHDLQARFLSGQADEVWVAFNLFKSAMTQKPLIRKFLPIELSPEASKAGAPTSGMTLFDPSEGEVLDVLVGKLLDMRLYSALVSSAAGEHGARMTAMDNSTRNCESLIDRYTLLRNRARQATITRELIEIIGGAEALH